MEVGDEYDVIPISVSRLGEATAIVEGRAVYIPNGVVGKTVKIRITRVFPRYAYAIAVAA